ncbi:MAG: hypothetical protein ABSF71_09770 [Terriglobia bacterium]
MSGQEMRKSALRQYVVFRVKAIEFLDLSGLHQGLLNGNVKPYPPFRLAGHMADSLRTVLLSWFALFVDKNGLDVIKLWKEVFPHHAKRVQEAWTKMEPTWPVLRDFRNRAGFHADKPLKFFGARHGLRSEIKQVEAAMVEFEKLFKFFLKAEEKELPELGKELDSLLDELEKKHSSAYKRGEFKAYMMIPDSHTNPATT